MYFNFFKDETYPKKDFESFYNYYIAVYAAEVKEEAKDEVMYDIIDEAIAPKQKKSVYVFQNKEIFKEGFDRFIQQRIEESVDDFLNNKNKEYSNRYEGFVLYLKEKTTNSIDAMPEEKIKRIYEDKYRAYLKLQDKNEFGLEIKYVDEQLRKIFR
jgi:hypothetical protein